MKFKKHDNNNTNVNEDISTIRSYLTRVGDLTATDEELEDSYADFSERIYAAGWMMIDDDILDEFATWLDNNLND